MLCPTRVAECLLFLCFFKFVDGQTGGGVCKTNNDCGFNSVIFGGQCVEGKCVCYSGYTCEFCQAVALGDGSCKQSAGGGKCRTREDCNGHGSCALGRCVCFPGFACSSCDVNNNICTRDPDRDGIYPCNYNAECGVAQENLPTLGTEALGTGGQCGTGERPTCKCDEGFGCPKCNIKLDAIGNATFAAKPPATGLYDYCEVPWGGGRCVSSSDCYQGVCVNGACVCYPGWGCPYCFRDIDNEYVRGGDCDDYITGYGKCQGDLECTPGHGSCNSAGRCECASAYTCSDCSLKLNDVLAGTAECNCTKVKCVHGTCSKGLCQCEDGWTGVDCSIESCPWCFNHGTCNSYDKCDCEEGYQGYDCGHGGAECTDDSTCGFNGDVLGGRCVNGKCSCYDGFTCPHCESRGKICIAAAGGAPCTQDSQCGEGGRCRDGGFCVCDPGFTCQRCNQIGDDCREPYPFRPRKQSSSGGGSSQSKRIITHPAVIAFIIVGSIGVVFAAFRGHRACNRAVDGVERNKRSKRAQSRVQAKSIDAAPQPAATVSRTAHLQLKASGAAIHPAPQLGQYPAPAQHLVPPYGAHPMGPQVGMVQQHPMNYPQMHAVQRSMHPGPALMPSAPPMEFQAPQQGVYRPPVSAVQSTQNVKWGQNK